MIDVKLRVHLEAGENGGMSWWAESPQVPGFSAAGDTLEEIVGRARWALSDILREERGEEVGAFSIELVGSGPTTTANAVAVRNAAPELPNVGSPEARIATPPDRPVPSAA